MIYIHVPYCRSFCKYCGFYSEIPTSGTDSFVGALCDEIISRAREIPLDHSTVYIGGGTPSILSISDFRRIVTALASAAPSLAARPTASSAASLASAHSGAAEVRSSTPSSSSAEVPATGIALRVDEFTVEVNPDDVIRAGEPYFRELRLMGVNRISMGVQSLDDQVLRWMGRRHDAATARKAFRILRRAGFDNISIDLIFGFDLPVFFGHRSGLEQPAIPECPPESAPIYNSKHHSGNSKHHFGADCSDSSMETAISYWKQTLEAVMNLGGDGIPPEHISAYQLSIEPDSTLADMLADGRFREPSDELCAAQYSVLCDFLGRRGYNHYEISNFALPGHEARHNSAYWQHVPYIGFGPAAHSFLRDEVGYYRRWNRPDVHAYIHAATMPSGPAATSAAAATTSDPAATSTAAATSAAAATPSGPAATSAAAMPSGPAAAARWDGISEAERLTDEQLRLESLMLGLRTSTGIPAALLSDRNGNLTPAALKAIAAGTLIKVPSPTSSTNSADVIPEPASTATATTSPDRAEYYRIPESHFFISDDIISDLA